MTNTNQNETKNEKTPEQLALDKKNEQTKSAQDKDQKDNNTEKKA